MTWRAPALAALAGLFAGAVVGWRLHPDPPPGVDLAVALRAASSWRERATATRVEGPVRVVERWRTLAAPAPPPAPGCAPCPACEEHERVEERGPVTTTQATERAQETRVEQVVREVVRPAPHASWALSGGLQLLPDVRAEVGLEHRLLGPVWARAWALQPLRADLPAVGVGLRVEW